MRVILAAVIVGVLILTGACSSAEAPQVGDCVAMSGTQDRPEYEKADCGIATLRVLARRDEVTPELDCASTPGSTQSYEDYSEPTQLCLGRDDLAPDLAINTAVPGDCLTDTSNVNTVQRVPCTDPGARSKVLARYPKASKFGHECDSVPGATSTYDWSLVSTGRLRINLVADVRFCVAAPDSDPGRDLQSATAGDCVSKIEQDPGYAVVGCDEPGAAYRVVGRAENAFLDEGAACRAARGAIGSIKVYRGLSGYQVCLGRL